MDVCVVFPLMSPIPHLTHLCPHLRVHFLYGGALGREFIIVVLKIIIIIIGDFVFLLWCISEACSSCVLSMHHPLIRSLRQTRGITENRSLLLLKLDASLRKPFFSNMKT